MKYWIVIFMLYCGICWAGIEEKISCDVCGEDIPNKVFYKYCGGEIRLSYFSSVKVICTKCVLKAIETVEGLSITRDIWLEFNRAHPNGEIDKKSKKSLCGVGAELEGLEYYPKYYYSELSSKENREEVIEWYKNRMVR